MHAQDVEILWQEPYQRLGKYQILDKYHTVDKSQILSKYDVCWDIGIFYSTSFPMIMKTSYLLFSLLLITMDIYSTLICPSKIGWFGNVCRIGCVWDVWGRLAAEKNSNKENLNTNNNSKEKTYSNEELA